VISGQYITAVRPNEGHYDLSKGWRVTVEDFDPTSWTVRLGVGYKFGAPEPVKQDKRLEAGIKFGYGLAGNTGMIVSAEFNRLTQVSKSTTLSYGLAAENVFEKKDKSGNCSSLLLSAGFKVCQPYNSWFWGAKLYAGAGDYSIINEATTDDYTYRDYSKKVCAKGALELSAGLKISKLSYITANLRAGAHFGRTMQFENFAKTTKATNISGFYLIGSIGYSFIF
jgi:hypothetical protein